MRRQDEHEVLPGNNNYIKKYILFTKTVIILAKKV